VASEWELQADCQRAVLLDDSFSVLPGAFREGQRIVNGMRDILRLFLTRILYACLLIVAVAVIDMPFPLTPTHNALFTLLAVGLPTIGLAALARPAAVHPASPWGELVRFIAPAGWTLALTGLAVYLAFIRPDIGQPTPDQIKLAQTMLVTQSVLCGLCLVLFVAPPTRAWCGDGQSRLACGGDGSCPAGGFTRDTERPSDARPV
jgi:cation-transporting ATPase E